MALTLATAASAQQRRAFTLAELTAMGHGCRSTLYKHIGSGHLRARKRGKRLVVLLEDLETWLESLPQAAIAVGPPKKAA
jgi:hypothetical protein